MSECIAVLFRWLWRIMLVPDELASMTDILVTLPTLPTRQYSYRE